MKEHTFVTTGGTGASLSAGEGGPSKADTYKQAAKKAGILILFFLFGLFSPRIALFENIAPFGVSVAAAANPVTSLFVYGGMILSGLTGGGMQMKYLLAAGAVIGLKWVFAPFPKICGNIIFTPISAFIASFGSALALNMYAGANIYDFLLALSEGLLCAGGSFFFKHTGEIFTREKVFPLLKAERLSILAVLGMGGLVLAGIKIGDFSFGRIAGVVLILFFATYRKEAGGCMAGVYAGCIFSLADPAFLFIPAAYGLGGLCGGFFACFGRIGVTLSFLLCDWVVTVVSQTTAHAFTSMAEALLASILFLAVPKSISQGAAKLLQRGCKPEQAEQQLGMPRALSMRLENAARALQDISLTVGEVSQKLRKVNVGDISQVYTLACDKVCKGCGLNSYCWQSAYNESADALNTLTGILRQNGKVTPEDAPNLFRGRCCKLTALTEKMNEIYSEYYQKQTAVSKVEQVRDAVTEQYSLMSGLLSEISREIADYQNVDSGLAQKVETIAGGYAKHPVEVSCVQDKYGKYFVDITLEEADAKRLNGEFYERFRTAVKMDLDAPCIFKTEDKVTLSFFEKAVYTTQCGVYQKAYKNGKYCGDAYECFVSPKGVASFLISDGMGKGAMAAVDGNMARTLFARLMRAGFDPQSALKTVNSALMVKSGEESMASLDVASIDLYTGECTFYKAGAAASYVLRGNHVMKIEGVSMPAGILCGADFDSSQVRLSKDDLFVMISDGAQTEDDSWVNSFLKEHRNENPQRLATLLAQQARQRMQEEDDVTVLAVKILKGV